MEELDISRQVQSQPAPTRTAIDYHWICFFDWCEDNPVPFHIHVREVTLGHIPESWFTKPLNEECRQKKFKIRPFGQKMLSVFCKIEHGKRMQLLLHSSCVCLFDFYC